MTFLSIILSIGIQTPDWGLMLKEAYEDKDVAERMIVLLSEKKDRSALETAYLGSAEMLMADHSFFPLAKWKHFIAGTKYLDKAVSENQSHAGIRFLRFACQTKTPDFLGYKDGIEEDKQMILTDIRNLPNDKSKQHVIDFLLESKYISKSEKIELQKL